MGCALVEVNPVYRSAAVHVVAVAVVIEVGVPDGQAGGRGVLHWRGIRSVLADQLSSRS